MDDVKTAFVCVRCMDVKLRARSPETSYSGPALLCAICRHFGHGAVIPVTRCEWGHLTPLAHSAGSDAVATPPPDVVTVPREHLAEWITAMRCSEPYVACGHDNTQKRLDAIESMARALRSGEAGKGKA